MSFRFDRFMEASKKSKDGRAMHLTTKKFKLKPRQDLSTLHRAREFFRISNNLCETNKNAFIDEFAKSIDYAQYYNCIKPQRRNSI